MNFQTEYEKGQAGGNKGIPMGEGLQNVSNAINGIQRGRIYGIAAAPKAGKSTFANYAFVIQPYLYAMAFNIPIEWIYFSFELDRVSVEFDFAAHFLFHDHQIKEIVLPEGVTKGGSNILPLSPNYLRGRLIDDNGDQILVSKEIEAKLIDVYQKRIVPIFGKFDEKGNQILKGLIIFIETKDNPTGIYKYLKRHASSQGQFIIQQYGNSERITGYKPNNPNKYTIVITDHLRKLIPERGWQMKQTVDKYIEYSVELRNWCGYTFVHIIHLNRSMTDVQRQKQFGDMLYPNSDDIKDTGNLAEDADYVFTLFNPNDERYNLSKHFGRQIKDSKGNEIYPDLRTIHLVESRHCDFPQHFSSNMFGGLKTFEQVNFVTN